MNELIAENSTIDDRTSILMSMTYLYHYSKATRKMLQDSWTGVQKRVGFGTPAEDFGTALRRIANDFVNRIDDFRNPLTHLLLLRTLCVLDPEKSRDSQGKILEKALAEIGLPLKSSSNGEPSDHIDLYVPALLAVGVAESAYAGIVSFSQAESAHIEEALSNFETWQKQKLVLMSQSRYWVGVALICLVLGFWLIPIFDSTLLTYGLYSKIATFVTIAAVLYSILASGIIKLR
jgi:hypothetical protein